MAYSGHLVKGQTDAARSTNFAPDPAHAVEQTPDPYGGVHQVPPSLGQEYVGTYFPVDIAVGGGSVLATPNRSHQGRAGRAMVYSDDQHREQVGDLHAEDGQRGYVRATYQLPALQDARAEWSDAWYPGNTWPAHQNNSGAPAVLRGNKTAIPQNNPEGVREGMVREVHFKAERRLGRRKLRYTPQQLLDRRGYMDHNVPAPANADPTAAGAVLDAWQPLGAWSRIKTPALFRPPPTVSQALQARQQPVSDDVIGGGF